MLLPYQVAKIAISFSFEQWDCTTNVADDVDSWLIVGLGLALGLRVSQNRYTKSELGLYCSHATRQGAT